MKRILLTGGGTLGSVVPLVALAENLGDQHQYFWLGTKKGPEKRIVIEAGIGFRAICSGKLRRYFSWRNFSDPFVSLVGFFQALAVCLRWKPDLVVSAGGFVAVPVVWAARLTGAKVLLHQLDLHPGLANRLCLPVAHFVAVSWRESLPAFGQKGVWTGTMVRKNLHNQAGMMKRRDIIEGFGLDADKPMVLVTGGGTGAAGLNTLISGCSHLLNEKCTFMHLTGKDRHQARIVNTTLFRQAEFLNQSQMALALAAADVVISRAGMGSLSELAFLAKPAIIVPLPDTHQEANAMILAKAKAAMLFVEKDGPLKLASLLRSLLDNQKEAKEMGEKLNKLLPSEGDSSLSKLAIKLLYDLSR